MIELPEGAVQARTVPDHVERIAWAQARPLRTILERAHYYKVLNEYMEFYRAAPKGQMPEYTFVHTLAVEEEDEPGLLEKVTHQYLKRYGGKALGGELRQDVHPMIQWSLTLRGEMAEKLLSQQIPVFRATQFKGFSEYEVVLKEGLWAKDVDHLYETGMVSTMFLNLNVGEKGRRITVVMPYQEDPEVPCNERWNALMQHLEPWEVITTQHVRELSDSSVGELTSGVGVGSLDFKPATEVFLRQVPMTVKYKADVKVPYSVCETLLGEPHKVFDKGRNGKAWEYFFKVQDALFVIEGVDSEAKVVYAFKGKEHVARNFAEFCRLLTG
jgi:hypothetical protein